MQAAEHNAMQWNLDRRSFVNDRVEQVLDEVFRQLGTDVAETVVVLDPPRSGCADRVTEALLNARAKAVLYVSCNPATLARDVQRLSATDVYKLQRLALFDMFPQAAHFESVALLRNR